MKFSPKDKLMVILLGIFLVMALLFLVNIWKTQSNNVPPEIYASEKECIPHAKQKWCLYSKCIKGQSDGSTSYDHSVNSCKGTWDGWIPVNEVIAN